MFVRDGVAPVAAERFDGAGLPAAWARCGGRPFYANVIAYHNARPVGPALPDPAAFVEAYRVAAARDALRRALRREAQWPAPMNSERARARRELREFLLSHDDWGAFLRHPACRHLFTRGRWGPAQDVERAALGGSAMGRRLVVTTADPAAGSPPLSGVLPSLSTTMLGAAYALHRVHQQCGGRLPATVVEVGGGYGAFAWLYARQVPTAAYAIVDLAEMLAVQHYFLSHALPERRITFADEPDFLPQAGEVTLLPAALLGEAAPAGELMVSNFAFADMSADVRATIARREYFGARHLFLTGTLAGDPAGVGPSDPSEVVGPVMRAFPRVVVERLHVGESYLVMADR